MGRCRLSLVLLLLLLSSSFTSLFCLSSICVFYREVRFLWGFLFFVFFTFFFTFITSADLLFLNTH